MVAQRRLGLDVHEVLEVVDLEQRLGRVGHPPHDDGGDLDRVAVVVIDLELGGLEVAHPHGDATSFGQRVDPVQALLADRPVVAAEQDECAGFVGVDRREAAEADGREDDPEEQDPEAEQRQEPGAPLPHPAEDVDRVPDEQQHEQGHGDRQDHGGRDARQAEGSTFLVIRHRSTSLL